MMSYHDLEMLQILGAMDLDTMKVHPDLAAGIHFQVHQALEKSGSETPNKVLLSAGKK